jgi:hypothetical protein
MQNTRRFKRLTCNDACDKPSFAYASRGPGWPHFGRTTARSTQPLPAIDGRNSSKSTSIRAGHGYSRKFLRIRRLSNGRSALREERRAPSASQHRLAVLLPLMHLLKLLNNLVAQLVPLR